MSRHSATLALAFGLGLSAALPSATVFAAAPNDRPPKVCLNPQGRLIPCPDKDKIDRDAPEAPLAVGLPLSALAVFGVYVLRQCRRDADESLDGLAV